MNARRIGTLALSAALGLVGCNRYEPLSLHGAGSMRVEIEVYKGPLTISPVAQVGQLAGVISDTVRALDEWRRSAQLLLARGDCAGGPPRSEPLSLTQERDCVALESAVESSEDAIGAACYIINTPAFSGGLGMSTYLPVGVCRRHYEHWRHIERVRGTPAKTDATTAPTDQKHFEATLHAAVERAKQCAAARIENDKAGDARKGLPPLTLQNMLRCQQEHIVVAIDNLASIMRAASFRAADANLRYVPRSQPIRASLASFGFIGSEYGNQIQARIAVLSKQLADGKSARNLPVSDYLRDASTTDFIHIFDWLDATNGDRGFASFSPGGLDPADRIRMIERLTSDYYWEKINEVHASGQGDVAMAFIKDDLGNWNLRSFSNDPSELLRSYRSATDAALKTVATLARRAAKPSAAVERVGGARSALGLANQLATGEAPDGSATSAVDVAGLHGRAVARIAARRTQFQARARALKDEQNRNLAQAKVNQIAVDEAAAKVDAARRQIEAAQQGTNCGQDGQPSCDEMRRKAEEDFKIAEAARLDAERMRDEADLAAKAAERRLADLPKDAVMAVREVLADHLATVSAIQEGIAGVPAPASSTRGSQPD